MKNKIITINILSKEYPKLINRETNFDNAWIKCEIETEKGETWEGKIIEISSNGKYKIEILELLNS
jgi:hypothetical protein